jgi:GT2 family glycosyltransferase
VSPRIGVVVVHYGTDDLTLRCLRALRDDTRSPEAHVVLVDNGPGEGIAARVRAELPEVQVVVPGRNTGFAGGCNRGIAALPPEVELVALLNSDAVPEPGWLGPLEAALDADPRVGAVVPKTRFEGAFHELVLLADTTWRPGRGDPRALAWQPRAVVVAGVDVTDRCQLVEGFWEPGRGGRWAGERAVLRVPALEGATTATIHLATPPAGAVQLRIEDGPTLPLARGRAAAVEVPTAGPAVTVLANVGNGWRDDGYGLDLGRFEVDRGQHDAATEVPAWCGGAVLLRRSYLDDVGAFDERLFLYYEDLELSIRGAERGWRYRYEPASVVDHRVGSSAAGMATKAERLRERNRLLVLARHRPWPVLLAQLVRFAGITLRYVQREIVATTLRGAPPCGWLLKVRGLALLGALPRIPGQRASRRADRRRLRESRPWPDC